jgi:SAM-dependent methyltransferase
MRGGNVVEIRETPAWRHAAYAELVIRQAENSDADLFRERLDSWSPGRRILEFGCGAGGLAIPLAEHGYEVTGIDANPLVLDALKRTAEQRDLPIKCIFGLIEEATSAGTFDSVIIASVLLNAGDASYRAGLFREAANHLVDGGTLLLEHCDASFFSEVGELLEDQQDLVCKGRSDARWIGDIRYKFDNRTVVVPTQYHLVGDSDLAKELSRAGFTPVGTTQNLNRAARLSQFRRS